MMKKYSIDPVRKLCLLLEVPRSSNAVTDLFLQDANIHDVDVKALGVLLRTGRVSVLIRRFVHHSWYGPAGERPSRAGTS
jgi:hypothetical protein